MLGLLMVLGCGPGVEGVWEGQCTVETNKGSSRYDLVYAMTQDGATLAGDAQVETPFLTEPISGSVSGSVDGDAVDLLAELGDPNQNFRIEHQATFDRSAETLQGPCSVQVQQEVPFDGEASLSRTGALPEEE